MEKQLCKFFTENDSKFCREMKIVHWMIPQLSCIDQYLIEREKREREILRLENCGDGP